MWLYDFSGIHSPGHVEDNTLTTTNTSLEESSQDSEEESDSLVVDESPRRKTHRKNTAQGAIRLKLSGEWSKYKSFDIIQFRKKMK